MLKFQIFLVAILMSCVAFISCERVGQIAAPMVPEADTAEPGDTEQPDDMVVPEDVVESDDMGVPEDMTEPTDVVDMTDMDDTSKAAPSVVINELMADNDTIVADPQGDYDDWLELYNLSDTAVMLTGMYLSDKEDELTQWEFPENTQISANGYLVVWLDDDVDAAEGLHANFKLSKNGETVILVGTDAHGNRVLDRVTFEAQETDTAYGRLPDGTGNFQVVQATPGAPNMAQ